MFFRSSLYSLDARLREGENRTVGLVESFCVSHRAVHRPSFPKAKFGIISIFHLSISDKNLSISDIVYWIRLVNFGQKWV